MSATFWHVMHGLTVLALACVALWGHAQREMAKIYKDDADFWQERCQKMTDRFGKVSARLTNVIQAATARDDE